MSDYTEMSDRDLEVANQDLMKQKEQIRAEQLEINQVLTDRARRGVRGIYATKDRPFRGDKKVLKEVPNNVSDTDLLSLQGIHTEEGVSNLG